MRFLLTVHPMFGHLHAMAPLAQALKERGHEAVFATGESFGPIVRRAGLLHFPCGIDCDGSGDITEALPDSVAIKARFPKSVAAQQLHGFVQGLAPKMIEDLIGARQHVGTRVLATYFIRGHHWPRVRVDEPSSQHR